MNNKITDTHISILVPISQYQYTDMDIGASLNTTAFKVLYCAGQLLNLGVKKKYVWFRFPTDPIFFCRPYYFFNAIDRATLFSPGGCGLLIQRAKMVSVVTLIIEPNCLNSSIGNTHL